MDEIITVFTPIFNRAHLLLRLYKSLLDNSDCRIEWLIVDDGSEDDPKTIIDNICPPKDIVIKYIRKSNGGKHTAYNTALENANGKFFVCLDSDDLLYKGALSKVCDRLKCSVTSEVCGVLALKGDMENNLLSGEIRDDGYPHTLFEYINQYGAHGEYALVFLTETAKRYPFPVFWGERFISESVVYNRMSRDYCLLAYCNIMLMQCEYQTSGLSAQLVNLQKNNPKGFVLEFYERSLLPLSFVQRMINAAKSLALQRFCDERVIPEKREAPLLFLLAQPVGFCFYLFYKKRFRGNSL